MGTAVGNYDDIGVIERRISYLVGARLRDKDRIRMAMKEQDRIREQHPVSKGWDSVSVVRQWRQA